MKISTSSHDDPTLAFAINKALELFEDNRVDEAKAMTTRVVQILKDRSVTRQECYSCVFYLGLSRGPICTLESDNLVQVQPSHSCDMWVASPHHGGDWNGPPPPKE